MAIKLNMLNGILAKYPENFYDAANFVFWVEDKSGKGIVTTDTGGLTKWGISQKAYPDLDIANLSIDKAIEIYHDRFVASKADRLPNPVSVLYYSMSFNSGNLTAVQLLQAAMNNLLPNELKLIEDGVWGSKTDIALDWIKANVTVQNFLDEMVLRSFIFYITLSNKYRGQSQPWKPYLLSWMNRMVDFLKIFEEHTKDYV